MTAPATRLPYLSVVIPFFNEEENVKPLAEELLAVLHSLNSAFEVIFIDDGSTDRSAQMVKELQSSSSNIRLISFRKNCGQTAAFDAGIKAAKGEIIITLDADLQNNPADIPKIVEQMEKGFDVVSGWRKDRKDPFINRRLPSIMANGLISKIITDREQLE